MQNDLNQQPGFGARTASDDNSTNSNLTADQKLAASEMSGLAESYRQRILSGANWFFWIAALSIINSIILLSGGRWNFLAGLGVTQLIDGLGIGLSTQLGSTATIIALILDLLVAGYFVGMGFLARREMSWAFILGMIFYVLDGLIFLWAQEWFGLAFHAYVLFRLYQGFTANNKLAALKREVAGRPA